MNHFLTVTPSSLAEKRPPRIVGYCRVSSNSQDLAMQEKIVKELGAEQIYMEKASSRGEMPKRKKMFEELRAGDTVCLYALDRIGRSSRDLVTVLEVLTTSRINLVTHVPNPITVMMKDMADPVYSTSVNMFISMMSYVGQFERELSRRRCDDGIKARIKRSGCVVRTNRHENGWDESDYINAIISNTLDGVSHTNIYENMHNQRFPARPFSSKNPQDYKAQSSFEVSCYALINRAIKHSWVVDDAEALLKTKDKGRFRQAIQIHAERKMARNSEKLLKNLVS
jgi:hypothetical protein